MKVAIISAIIGDFDTLWDPEPQSIDCDFLMYTDNPSMVSNKWCIRQLQVLNPFPRQVAKMPKCMPDIFAKEYDITIWIDGDMRIKSQDFAKKMIELLGDQKLLVLKHWFRESVLEEINACKTNPKYSAEDMETVERLYGGRDTQLYACGILVRKNKDPEVMRFNHKWWDLESRYSQVSSLNDQVILPLALDFEPGLIEYKVWNEYIDLNHHAK